MTAIFDHPFGRVAFQNDLWKYKSGLDVGQVAWAESVIQLEDKRWTGNNEMSFS